jgi:polar amino acid transport system substrate-binding protein
MSASIGSQTGDYTVSLLEGMGAADLDLAATMEATIKKLQAGRLDYAAMGSTSVGEMQEAGYDIEVAHTLQENVMSIACSQGTSDEAVQAMQAALDEMIADGTQQEILSKYE